MGLKEAGIIRELNCGTNFAYVIEGAEDFSTTEYKVLQSQNSNVFIRCMKLLLNGRVELYYQTDGYRSLASLLMSIDGERFMTIMINLFTAIIEVKSNGFLSCQNIDISLDKIYIDTSNYMVRLIYIPTKTRGYESYGIFENELRTGIVRLLGSTPTIASPETAALSMNLIDGSLNLEALVGRCKGNVHATAGVARRTGMATSQQAIVQQLITPQQVIPQQVVPQQQSGQPSMIVSQGGLRLVAPKITIEVNKPEFVIGKHSAVDGVISFNNAISRRHCRVLHINGDYFVEDLGSSNGTYLNRLRLETNKPAPLHNGDWLRLADMDFQVYIG